MRLGIAAVALAGLIVGAVVVTRSGDEPARVLRGAPKPGSTLLATGNGHGERAGQPRAFLIDVRTDKARELEILAGGQDDGLVAGFVGDTIVAQRRPYTGDEQRPTSVPVLALDRPYRSSRQIGTAFAWHDSVEPGRLWVATAVFPAEGGRSHPRTLENMDLGGNVTTKLELSCCTDLIADTARGLLVSNGDQLQLLDRTDGHPTTKFPGKDHFVEAIHGDLAVLMDRDGCEDAGSAVLLDLVSGSRRAVGEPCRYMGASFSPTGDRLVLRTPTDGAAGDLSLLPLDGNGPAIQIPDSNSVDYATAWDGEGRIYYSDVHSNLRSYDPKTGRWRFVASPPIILRSLSTPT